MGEEFQSDQDFALGAEDFRPNATTSYTAFVIRLRHYGGGGPATFSGCEVRHRATDKKRLLLRHDAAGAFADAGRSRRD